MQSLKRVLACLVAIVLLAGWAGAAAPGETEKSPAAETLNRTALRTDDDLRIALAQPIVLAYRKTPLGDVWVVPEIM